MVSLVAMPVSRKEMEKHQNTHARQVDHATKQWEARENKVANNKKRKEWIERRNNVTYRNEYDRVRGDLQRARLPFGNIHQFRRRVAELQRLFF